MQTIISVLKTFFILLIFIGAIIGIAVAISSFLYPQKLIRYDQCILLQNPQNSQVKCFGCFNDICKDAPIEWNIYKQKKTGPNYLCAEAETGCELIQQ